MSDRAAIETVPANPHRPPRLQRLATRALTIGLSLYVIAYISGFLDDLGIRLFGAHRALVYSAIILLVFLLYPARAKTPRTGAPWYDIAMGLAGAGASLYAFARWDAWLYGVSVPTATEQILALVLIVLSLEAARRALGLGFTLVGVVFAVYPLVGQYLPGILATGRYSSTQLAQFFYLSGGSSGVFGTPMEIFTTTVAIFLLFGTMLKATGAADIFLQVAMAVSGRYRGGMGKVAVVSSALFSTISGVGVANVMITGGFTIPAMRRSGYRPAFAAALEATASTGGILMPPVMGAAAFLMADIIGVSYWTIAVAAFLPSLLYYLAIFLIVDAEGAKRDLRGVDRSEIAALGVTLRKGWFLFVAIAALLFLIGYVGYPVDQSALIATGVLLACSVLTPGRLSLRALLDALEEGGLLLAQIGAAGAVIGIIMSGFSLTGLGALLPVAMSSLAGDSVFVLLLMAALSSLILGMGAPPLLVYVILAATVAPALIRLGIEPLAAHMFIFYYGMLAMITPPVAISVLIAARIAETNFWPASVEAVRLGLVAFVIPFFFVYQPALLFQGGAATVGLAMASAVIGVTALGCGLSRYLFNRPAPLWEAALLVSGGFALVFPGIASDVIGGACLAPSVVRSLLRRSAARNALSTTGPNRLTATGRQR